MSQSWLLKFGLGGVQDFISQATRVRELAAGSILVSRAALEAAKTLMAPTAELLLPATAPPAGDLQANFPHQIVARVRVDGSAEVARKAVIAVAKAMTGAARDSWTNAATASLKELPAKVKKRFLPEPMASKAQLEETLETHWVALPETGDYRRDFDELLRAFEDRRWTRDFKQLIEFSDPGHWSWTCTQCGVRASLLQPEARKEWPTGIYFARRRESLCTPCAARRQWSITNLESYPSTHLFARDRFFRHPAYATLRAALKAAEFSDRDIGIWLEDFDEIEAGEARSPVSSVMEIASKYLRVSGDRFRFFPSLPAYYALVLFDGDQMGRWFSGEFFDQKDDLASCHGRLSNDLLAFTESLRTRISDRAAFPREAVRLVYAGGDDALLISPLDFLFPLLRLLKSAWREHLGASTGDVTGNRTKAPTFTLHASLVHEKAPLQPTVARLHHLLDLAKDRLDRDGFSLLCDVRAGSETHFLAKWDELDAIVRATEAFSTWRLSDPGQEPTNVAARKAALATTLLRTVEASTGGFFDGEFLAMRAPLRRELERLGSRSGKSSPEEWAGVKEWLLARAATNIDSGERCPLRGQEAFTTALETLGFLARELTW